jgi:hypothetical protein
VLEKEGLPVVVVGTDEFESLARLESKARGLPSLPVVITKHPIGGLKPEQVAARAGELLDGVTAAVVQPVAAGHAAD